MLHVCRCGPRSRALHVADARPHSRVRGSDPTGTLPLQRRFTKDLDARWNTVRRMIPNVVTQRADAVNIVSHASITGQDPIKAFQSWLDEAMRQIVLGQNGAWTLAYVRAAGDIALLRAGTLTQADAPPADRVPTLQSLCITELQGIIEAVSQQAVRVFAHGLLTKQSPSKIARDVSGIIASTGVDRGHLLVSFISVRTHSAVTLDTFRAANVPLVGTVAERAGTTRPIHVLARDAKKAKPKKVKWAEPDDLVEVLTAGDDAVCEECQDISDDGPYTLDEAERLIPLHPRCRCAFIPWADERYASVHEQDALVEDDKDWSEELHPRDKDGKFAEAGGTGGADEHVVKLKSALTKLGVPHDHDPDIAAFGGHVISVAHHDAEWVKHAAAKNGVPIFSETKGQIKTHFNIPEKADPKYAVPKEIPLTSTSEAPIDMKDLKKVGGAMGSNDGGVYEGVMGDKYYIKKPATPDHVTNELLAAKLYQLAGSKTMNYIPVKGGEHVATELQTLDKNNISQFTDAERKQAQSDFAVHAWLANWDAAGTGGDNQVVVNGQVATVDTGGSLKYRAKGGEKGAAFGDTVTETNTLRDPGKNYDAAKLYGDMTNDEIKASIARVTSLSNQQIAETVLKNGGDGPLAVKLIARKEDLAAQAAKMSTAPQSVVATPAADPIKQHLSSVKGTTAERIDMRKQLKNASDPATQKLLKQKILASFLKQHGATSGEKKADIASKLAQYSQKYKMPNPLTQAAQFTSAAPVQTIKIGTPVTPPTGTFGKKGTETPGKNFTLPKGYAAYSQSEKDGYDDIVKMLQKGGHEYTEKGAHNQATNYVEAAAQRLQYVKHDGTLTPVEAAHVVAYSGSQYRQTNAALRAGTMTEELFKHVEALDTALGKLPGHDGETVWRKADLSPMIAEKYKPGHVVTEWGFTSTSKKQGTWSGDYRFTIETKKSGSAGKDIVNLSSHGDSEAEVLFKSGTRFLVTKREGNKIHMREVG
jgi:hypothetical protein